MTAKLGQNDITPLSQIKRIEVTASNSTDVTIGVGATTIVTANFGTVINKDRILVASHCYLTKGATSGMTAIYVDKSSGTATIAFHKDRPTLQQRASVLANEDPLFTACGICSITATGTLVLKLTGTSAGSNAVVSASDGQIYGLVMRGE